MKSQWDGLAQWAGRRLVLCLVAFSILHCVNFCGAQEAVPAQITLRVGDAAPALTVDRWWGTRSAEFYRGKIFVIDFWASWCGHCRDTLPELNELASRYADRGVKVVAVNTWDTGKISTVEGFINSDPFKNFKLAWALDKGGKNGISGSTWMYAAGVSRIPTAFVVASNKLVWFGRSTELEPVIKGVLDGTFNISQEREKREVLIQKEKLRLDQLAAIKAGDWKTAAALYETRRQRSLGTNEVDAIDTDWMSSLIGNKDFVAAHDFARFIGNKYYFDKPIMLQNIALRLSQIPNPKDRDGDLILQFVERVRKLDGDTLPGWMFEVEAAGYASLGDYAAAVKSEEKYIAGTSGSYKTEALKKLDLFKAKANK